MTHHWISSFDLPYYLITDRGAENVNTEIAHCFTLFNIRHSQGTLHAPWTNGLVEVQKKSSGTHLRLFLHDNPEIWSIAFYFFACAHNIQPLSHLHVSLKEFIFHKQPRIPLNFQLNLLCFQFRDCTAQNSSDLPYLSHYQPIDLNTLFHRILLKRTSNWFLVSL